jgi:hypothetical protein
MWIALAGLSSGRPSPGRLPISISPPGTAMKSEELHKEIGDLDLASGLLFDFETFCSVEFNKGGIGKSDVPGMGGNKGTSEEKLLFFET